MLYDGLLTVCTIISSQKTKHLTCKGGTRSPIAVTITFSTDLLTYRTQVPMEVVNLNAYAAHWSMQAGMINMWILLWLESLFQAPTPFLSKIC